MATAPAITRRSARSTGGPGPRPAQPGGSGPRGSEPPSGNTGGKYPEAKVDWLTATAVHVDGGAKILPALALILPGQLSVRDLGHGGNGFTHGMQVRTLVELQLVDVCRVFWGGEAQRGRFMIDVPGASCGMVDWQAMYAWLGSLTDARITRLDVAVDFPEGEFGVSHAARWYRQGKFNCSGRNPSSNMIGDWIGGDRGRTIEVGRRVNGKLLRVYEKGKQLGDSTSPWTRFEVQFGSRDRVIPFDALLEPARYFVGAYPALEELMGGSGDRIKTVAAQGFIVIENALTNIRRCWGKWIDLLRGVDSADLVESLRIREVPARYQSSAVAAGVPAHLAFQQWREKQWTTQAKSSSARR